MIAVVQLENSQQFAVFAAVFGIKTCSAACAPVMMSCKSLAFRRSVLVIGLILVTSLFFYAPGLFELVTGCSTGGV